MTNEELQIALEKTQKRELELIANLALANDQITDLQEEIKTVREDLLQTQKLLAEEFEKETPFNL